MLVIMVLLPSCLLFVDAFEKDTDRQNITVVENYQLMGRLRIKLIGHYLLNKRFKRNLIAIIHSVLVEYLCL